MLSKYVTPKDIEDIKNASTFEQLLEVALRILGRMPNGSIGVCDPISTKSIPPKEKEANHIPEPYVRVCRKLMAEGYPIFDESIYYKKIEELKSKFFIANPGKEVCDDIVKKFFKPLLLTGKIKTLLILPNWELMYFLYWEESFATSNNIETITLPINWETTDNLGKVIKLPLPPSEKDTDAGNLRVA